MRCLLVLSGCVRYHELSRVRAAFLRMPASAAAALAGLLGEALADAPVAAKAHMLHEALEASAPVPDAPRGGGEDAGSGGGGGGGTGGSGVGGVGGSGGGDPGDSGIEPGWESTEDRGLALAAVLAAWWHGRASGPAGAGATHLCLPGVGLGQGGAAGSGGGCGGGGGSSGGGGGSGDGDGGAALLEWATVCLPYSLPRCVWPEHKGASQRASPRGSTSTPPVGTPPVGTPPAGTPTMGTPPIVTQLCY
eukprot:39699-Chlamydomonas_euryale.AAC.1